MLIKFLVFSCRPSHPPYFNFQSRRISRKRPQFFLHNLEERCLEWGKRLIYGVCVCVVGTSLAATHPTQFIAFDFLYLYGIRVRILVRHIHRLSLFICSLFESLRERGAVFRFIFIV